jgi:hypothetical protein
MSWALRFPRWAGSYRGGLRDILLLTCAILFTGVWWSVDHHRSSWLPMFVILILISVVGRLCVQRFPPIPIQFPATERLMRSTCQPAPHNPPHSVSEHAGPMAHAGYALRGARRSMLKLSHRKACQPVLPNACEPCG